MFNMIPAISNDCRFTSITFNKILKSLFKGKNSTLINQSW